MSPNIFQRHFAFRWHRVTCTIYYTARMYGLIHQEIKCETTHETNNPDKLNYDYYFTISRYHLVDMTSRVYRSIVFICHLPFAIHSFKPLIHPLLVAFAFCEIYLRTTYIVEMEMAISVQKANLLGAQLIFHAVDTFT